MASAICDNSRTIPDSKHVLGSSFMTEEQDAADSIVTAPEVPISSPVPKKGIPAPPPLPAGSTRSWRRNPERPDLCCFPKEPSGLWDELFKSGIGADVCIITKDQLPVLAHFSILSMASPVLGKFLQEATPNNGLRYLRIPGVPNRAVYTFIRFLYSACYEEQDMEKLALHLLVLSHSFAVPRLKRVCMQYLEKCWLNTETVIDVLQLALKCDAPRLSFVCIRMAVKKFEEVASSDGWKVMRRVNPVLEQELLESVVEADTRKEERARKLHEMKVYQQLHEGIEAIIHICRDGCKSIGPRDKMLKENQAPCGFSACKAIEMLVRHFSSCKVRGSSGCAQCMRLWQLLELHSRMCDEPESCNIPLCKHFKEKIRRQTKDEAMWRGLVRKVMEAKRKHSLFSTRNCTSS